MTDKKIRSPTTKAAAQRFAVTALRFIAVYIVLFSIAQFVSFLVTGSYYLGNNQSTIDIATQILSDEPVADDVRKEALYNRAKAYIAQEQFAQAFVDLTPLAKEVRTANGAEAKYLLAYCYFRQNDLDKAEEEVMSFAQMNTRQQYWLARALVLLSDVNVRRGDDFQARQYLLTLQANYRQQDDIQTMVSERLAALDEKEREQVVESVENED